MLRRIQRKLERVIRHLFFPEDETRWLGLNERIENILTLIKMTHDITKVPKAHGRMRVLQMANLALLQRIVAVLDRNGITYWLGSGTLIGAVRHGGYIPWDDDIDICTTREGHNRVMCAIEEAFGGDGEIFAVKSDCIRVYQRGTPCQIDIFAWDVLEISAYDENTLSRIKASHDEKCARIKYDFSKLLTQERTIAEPSDDDVIKMAEELRTEFSGPCRVIMEGIEESHHSFLCWPYDDVFPLAKIMFEGVEFNCPRKVNLTLFRWFGDFMRYPETVHQHDDILARIDDKWAGAQLDGE